jgi:dCMP deaminase
MKGNDPRVKRLGWEQFFFGIADLSSKRSACLKRSVGAVLVRDNMVISTGYNGTPPGDPNCEKCTKTKDSYDYCPAIHAELNAIFQCAKEGKSCKGADMYTTIEPCIFCIRAMKAVGIKSCHWPEGSRLL